MQSGLILPDRSIYLYITMRLLDMGHTIEY